MIGHITEPTVCGINREPNPAWFNPYQNAAQPIMDDLMQATMANRMADFVDGVTAGSAFSKLLYGDTVKWSDRPLSYRMKWYLQRQITRIRDAWLVLTGRADIGGDW